MHISVWEPYNTTLNIPWQTMDNELSLEELEQRRKLDIKRRALKQAQKIALEEARKNGTAYYVPVDGVYGNLIIVGIPPDEA